MSIYFEQQFGIVKGDRVNIGCDFTDYLNSGEYIDTATVTSSDVTISFVQVLDTSYEDAHRTDFVNDRQLIIESGKAVLFAASGSEIGEHEFNVSIVTNSYPPQQISRKGILDVV